MLRKMGGNLFLAFLVVTFFTGTVFAEALPSNTNESTQTIFSDVSPSHWAYSYIVHAYENGCIHGDGSGKFRPNDPVSQVEFLVMLANTYPDELSVEKKGNPWYAPYIELARRLGLSNIQDNPSTQTFTRGDLAIMLAEVMTGKQAQERDAVSWLLQTGISNGKTASTYEGYHPHDTLSRAEALTFLVRVIDYVDEHQDGVLLGNRSIINEAEVTGDSLESKVSNLSLDGAKIGWKVSRLIKEFGEPERILVTDEYYDWYIYNKGTKHLRYAVYQDQVVGLFSNSEQVFSNDLGIEIGTDTQQSVRSKFQLYEMKNRDDLYTDSFIVKIYYDQYADNAVDALQVLYLPEDRPLSRTVDRDRLERDYEWGIFYLTNSYRAKHLSPYTPLIRSSQADKSSYLHSKDMYDQDYFDHINLLGLTPFDRMESQGIHYRTAGENIAYGFENDIEVMSGWINSLGHRNNLLYEDFTHLGVGVYKRYYTQNFYSEW